MNNKTCLSCAGNSTFPEMPVDNRFTHHRNNHLDVLQGVEAVETEEEEEETEEVDYLPRKRDQACSHHMDERLTLTNSSVANQSLLWGTEQKLNHS
jgi:hypothetical protein